MIIWPNCWTPNPSAVQVPHPVQRRTKSSRQRSVSKRHCPEAPSVPQNDLQMEAEAEELVAVWAPYSISWVRKRNCRCWRSRSRIGRASRATRASTRNCALTTRARMGECLNILTISSESFINHRLSLQCLRYLERQDFLQRTDVRQFEIEKNLRQARRQN